MTPEVICHFFLGNENIVQCLSNQLQEGVEKFLGGKKKKLSIYCLVILSNFGKWVGSRTFQYHIIVILQQYFLKKTIYLQEIPILNKI